MKHHRNNKPYLFGEPAKKIRTYDFVHDRVTDHRSGVTLHGIKDILDGNYSALTEPLHLEKSYTYFDLVGQILGNRIEAQEEQ
jgi:protein subunit release factor A